MTHRSPDAVPPDRVGNGSQAGEHLTLLTEMMRDFVQSGDFGETLRRGLARITERLGAEASSLFLVEEETESPDVVCTTCFGPVDVTGLRLRWGSGIVGRCIAGNRPLMVSDVRDDPDFAGATVEAATGFRTRSILAAPLSVGPERLGAIEVINKRDPNQLFTRQDQELLEGLCHAAALAITNVRLTARLVEEERLNRELELAAAVQQDLLPPPAEPAFPVHGLVQPMYRVSGDFYDVIPRPDGKVWFCVGDVSGKGMNAALLMARTSSLLRCLAKQTNSPGTLLASLNVELCEKASRGMFVTLACGLYDPTTGVLRLASAGHEPALLHDSANDSTEMLAAESPPLGIAPELIHPDSETTVRLREGQTLYVFTDGLTEAASADGTLFGAEGVTRLVSRCSAQPVHLRPKSLLAGVMALGHHPRDDLTVLVLSRPVSGGNPEPAVEETLLAEDTLPGLPESLGRIRALIRSAALRRGADPDWTEDLVLAVDEACQNVVRHGYAGGRIHGDIFVQVLAHSEGMTVRIADTAAPVGPGGPEPKPRDELRPGGLGMHLLRSLTDEWRWEPGPGGVGNVLSLRKAFGPRAAGLSQPVSESDDGGSR